MLVYAGREENGRVGTPDATFAPGALAVLQGIVRRLPPLRISIIRIWGREYTDPANDPMVY